MNAKQHNDNLIREFHRLSNEVLIPQFSPVCVYGFIWETCGTNLPSLALHEMFFNYM